MNIKKAFPSTLFISFSIFITAFLISACSRQDTDKGLAPAHTDNPRIYFSAKNIGPAVNIYSIDTKGTITKLTDDDRVRDLDMDVSASGDLVFTSNRKKNYEINLEKHSEAYHVFKLPKSASEPAKVYDSDASELQPQFSPDEKWIALVQRHKDHQTVMLLNNRENQPPRSLLSGMDIQHYDWSPDSKTLAIAHREKAFAYLSIVYIDSGRIENLLSMPSEPPQKDYTPTTKDNYKKRIDFISWAPNGKHIAFIRNPLYPADRELHIYHMDSHSEESVSKTGVHVQDGMSWSKNSETLLYSALVNYQFYFNEQTQKQVYKGGMHIFKYEINGGSTQLTSGDHMFRYPTYSPDEKKIAFYYADKLGARTYSLNTMNTEGGDIKTLFDNASPQGTIIWR